jgi:hypothetical protein
MVEKNIEYSQKPKGGNECYQVAKDFLLIKILLF